MQGTPARLLTGAPRGAVAALGALCVAAALAAPPAQDARLGLAPGDVTMAVRFGLVALACLAFASATAASGRAALGAGLAALAPALLFAPGFPALLAPLGLVPLYTAALRARSVRGAAGLGACAGAALMLGAAGWIFHYFERPFVPALLALAVAAALWAAAMATARALVPRSALWIPLAAALVPAGEMARGEWMDPPLPGLLLAHANADGALARLAPWIGEAGIGFAVALVGLAGAAWLARAPRARALGRLTPLALVFALLAAMPPAGARARADAERTRICAIGDPLRGRGTQAFGGGGDAAVFALAARAEALGCEVAVLPEYSLRLAPQQVVTADWGVDRLAGRMVVIGGASISDREGGARRLRNAVCRLHLGPGRQINCAGAFDKLVFAPFGEAALFQDAPRLARIGARLSQRASGAKFTPLHSVSPVGVLPIGGGRRAGVAICWEVLVPGVFERRGVAGPGDVDLLVVVSDLGGFGGSRVAIDQLRRAASLHAVSLRAPLLLAATHDPLLVTASGRLAAPVERDSFLTVWEIAL